MDKTIIVVFQTSHGEYELTARLDECFIDICRRYALPASQLTTYLRLDNNELSLVVRPTDPIVEYIADKQLVLIPNRNLDYFTLLGGDQKIVKRSGASTWLRFRQPDKNVDVMSPSCNTVIELLTPKNAQEIVASHVKATLKEAGVSNEPLVVGVSGGGDSNSLLKAIVQSELVEKKNIHPVMMLGIPDWDKGIERAEAICQEQDLTLNCIKADDTAKIMGFSDRSDWITKFERIFPNDDLEIMGVYGVRKVLQSVASKIESTKIVIGTNLEDCLADALYFICRGKIPFPKPAGLMGGIKVICPLWLTPKALIDGCYPKYSKQNYDARYPSQMFGRAYYYYLAQMLVDAYPGAAEEILLGSGKLSKEFFEEYEFDHEFSTPTMSNMPPDARSKLRLLFSGDA